MKLFISWISICLCRSAKKEVLQKKAKWCKNVEKVTVHKPFFFSHPCMRLLSQGYCCAEKLCKLKFCMNWYHSWGCSEGVKQFNKWLMNETYNVLFQHSSFLHPTEWFPQRAKTSWWITWLPGHSMTCASLQFMTTAWPLWRPRGL